MEMRDDVTSGMDEPRGAPGSGSPILGWSVVANVCAETRYGVGDALVRPGVKHFPPGTKVWVLPAQWGDASDRALVVGRHRGAPRRFVQMVVPLEHLANFRVEGVYSPAVNREMRKAWDPRRGAPGQWSSKEAAWDKLRRHPMSMQRIEERER
jgi:hypothetical protein